MSGSATPRDLTCTLLSILCIGVLIAASFWIMQPFLTSILWAVMIVVATWPQMLWLQERLWNRRFLAVLVMMTALLLLLIIPFFLAIITIADHAGDISDLFRSRSSLAIPPPPEWVRTLPLAGARIAGKWQQIAAMQPAEISARLAPHAAKVLAWVVAQAGSAGMMLVHLFLTVVITAILYGSGEKVAGGGAAFCGEAGRSTGD